MADISQYLQDILDAVYGEDVRNSIHDAIEIINDVSEVILATGTAVTSASSSSTGFYTGSLYLNTNTYELWKCIGTDSWQSQGILKGDAGSPGQDGEDGNKWYRSPNISGKSPNPTVYSSSGITEANAGDLNLNVSEGAVYHCVTGGDASTATWSYDFTMTGGGGSGDTVSWNQIQPSTGSTKIAEISINGFPTDVYAPSGGGGGSTTFAGLTDTDINNPAEDQIVQYKNVGGSMVLQNANMPTIPTVNDATLTIQKNGTTVNTFTANASSNVTANIVTGEYIKTASVSSGSVTFTGVDDSVNSGGCGYDVFFDVTSSSTNKSPYAKLTSISGEGTSNCSLTYQTDADDGTNTAHLYQYK